MVVRESQASRYTPRPPGGRQHGPASRTRKGPVVLPVHPSVADTLVEGVRVVFDDWTDDMDRSMDHPAVDATRPPPPVVRQRAARIVAVEPVGEASRREAPRAPEVRPPKAGWARVAGLLAAIVVAGSLFFALGGFGALLVALAAAAGAVMMALPTGIDVVVVPAAPPATEIVAPAAEGRSDADLVVQPDPGFTGGNKLPIPKVQR